MKATFNAISLFKHWFSGVYFLNHSYRCRCQEISFFHCRLLCIFFISSKEIKWNYWTISIIDFMILSNHYWVLNNFIIIIHLAAFCFMLLIMKNLYFDLCKNIKLWAFTFFQHICRAHIASLTTYDGVEKLNLPVLLKSFIKEYHYKHPVKTVDYTPDTDLPHTYTLSSVEATSAGAK